MAMEHSPKSEKCTRKACDQCTASKTRCDGAEPCQRCCKRNVVCNFSSRRRSGPKRKRGSGAACGAPAPAKQATTATAAPAPSADTAGGSPLHAATVGLPGAPVSSSELVVPPASTANMPWSSGGFTSASTAASFVVTAASSASPLSSTRALTPSLRGPFTSAAPAAAAAAFAGLPAHSGYMAAGRFGGMSPATVQTPWQLHQQQQQQQQQLPFFGGVMPGAAAGMMPPMSMGFSPSDLAMMSTAQLPPPLPAASEPTSFEIAALRADPRYLIKYMELVNTFLPLVEVSKLGEALAAAPLPPPPPPVLLGPDGMPADPAAEAAAAAGEASNAHRMVVQAMLWAAVGLGALFSGDDKCAARQMRLSRACLQRCFDSPEPELVAIFLLHVVYWFHKVDVKKVQRYMGYAQQAARDAGEQSVHSDVLAVLRFMSAVMRVSVTTAVAYEPGAPRAPEVLARIKGPKRFIAIIEDVFFNMFLAFPPQGGGGYIEDSMPARLTRALQEADALLEAMERPSVIAKASIQGLHAYFQLAAGQTDLALRAAEGTARSVAHEPMCLHFPPCFVLSRGVSSLLRSCGSMPAAFAIEAAMAPLYTQVVYANSVCSVGRELLRVFMSPPLTPLGKVDVSTIGVSSAGDRNAVLGSLSSSLVSCGNGSGGGGGGGGSDRGNGSVGGSGSSSSSGEFFGSSPSSTGSGGGDGGSGAMAAAAAGAACPAPVKRNSLVLDLSSCGGGDLTGIDDIDIDGDMNVNDRLSPMSLSFLEGAIEAFPTPPCGSAESTTSARISPPTVQQPTLLSPTPSPSLEHGPAKEQAMQLDATSASPSPVSFGLMAAAAASAPAAAEPALPPPLPVPSDSPVLAPKAKRLFPAQQALLRLQQHTLAADNNHLSPSARRASPFLFMPSATSGRSENGEAAATAAVEIPVAPSPMELEQQHQQQQEQQQQQHQQQHREVSASPQEQKGAAAAARPSLPRQHDGMEANGHGLLNRPRISVSVTSCTPAAVAPAKQAVPGSPVTASTTLASETGSSAPASPAQQQPLQGPPEALEWQKVLLQQQARQQSQLQSLQDQLQQRRRQQEAAATMQLQRSPATAPMAMAIVGMGGEGGGSSSAEKAGQCLQLLQPPQLQQSHHQQQQQQPPGGAAFQHQQQQQQSPGDAAFQRQEMSALPRRQQQQRQQQHLQLLQQQLLEQQQRHKSLMATAAAAQAASAGGGQQPQEQSQRPAIQAAAAMATAVTQPQAWTGLPDQKAPKQVSTASLLLHPTPPQREQQQHQQLFNKPGQQQQQLFDKPWQRQHQQQPDELSILRQQVTLSQQALPAMMAAGGAGAESKAAAGGRDRGMQDLQRLGLHH